MRNSLHVIFGYIIMFIIGYLCQFSTYTLEGKGIGVTALSIILGILIGYHWELYREQKTGSKMDTNDILRTTLGFLLGGLTTAFLI